jgi:hypothetical protein
VLEAMSLAANIIEFLVQLFEEIEARIGFVLAASAVSYIDPH